MSDIAYDEMASGQGSIRPHWRETMASVWGLSLELLREKQARAAVLLPQDRFDAGELAHSLNTLLSAPVLLTRMASAARELGRPTAVAELADIVDCTAPPNGNGASTRSTILRSAVA